MINGLQGSDTSGFIPNLSLELGPKSQMRHTDFYMRALSLMVFSFVTHI